MAPDGPRPRGRRGEEHWPDQHGSSGGESHGRAHILGGIEMAAGVTRFYSGPEGQA